MSKHCVLISLETLQGARDRVLDDLNKLTDGKADRAIKYVEEFIELNSLLSEAAQGEIANR